ncbi:acetylxylan esterase [Pseudarthrobacter sp. J75]|uniref:acetylxylan esterase n=1 Tax=unclassified Pseudarthrobacter TaxID=2647000 RepID=UPI002E81EA8F|nr:MULTISPECIES: acetylxylan esterase [unclassified Pseudarthrobacter]MEE2522206.1 acetylxylan esterase [Pseudarthrobacter sp. J47]MEE2528148.1 acetylxylan esterase [Pseudarthrobacter sp. J75]MEE2567851.1 acetylxylan esterase [Pseudarthrobacter sp. J64]
MPLFDLPLEKLRDYTSPVAPPSGFKEFWDRTIAEAREFPLAATFEPVENYLAVIDTFDVTFAGFGGAPVKGWLHLPAGRDSGAELPVVVQYVGYSGGRGLVNQETKWAQAGYAHFIMDTRGQGYGGTSGATPDPHSSAGDVAFAGLMTRGVGHQDDYYYRRVYVDAFRAIEAAQSHPAVDPSKVVLHGISQGGGIVVAAAGLVAGRLDGVVAALPDVPFLQDFPRAIDITPRGPYPEIAGFLARHRDRYEAILQVLNYFDGVNLGRWATAPALYSAAQMDDICPPSTVFASFNAYGTGIPGTAPTGGIPAKDIEVYRFNNHEGGQEHQWIRQLVFLRKILG